MDSPIELKCDETGCDWNSVVSREAWQEWVNKPCPKCGTGEIIDDEEAKMLRVCLAFESFCKVMSEETGEPLTKVRLDSLTGKLTPAKPATEGE